MYETKIYLYYEITYIITRIKIKKKENEVSFIIILC